MSQLGIDQYLPNPGVDKVGLHQRPGDAAETQIGAAIEAKPSTGTWRRRVLNMIAANGDHGATDDEMQVALRLNPSTQRPDESS